MLTRLAALFFVPLFIVLPPLARAAPPPRLSPDISPTSQSVRLRIDPARTDYDGSVRIELRIDNPTPHIRLHAERMRLTRTTLTGPAGAVPVSADFGTGDASSTLTLTPSSKRPIPEGRYTLSIDFQNSFGTRAVGLYRMVQTQHAYAFTQFEPADAREAFPCFDEPRFKIPFQISLEVPQHTTAVSNTPIAQQLSARGTKTVVFEKTRPLPTYLLAFAVGPFESVPIPGLDVPGSIVVPHGQRHLASLAASMTPPILRALEAYFGRRYPYEKLDFIAVPEFWPGAMEHPGAVTYADRILLVDEKMASPAQRRTLAAVIAHELAHMWFGNLVTMAWWDDLWLNESFASWIGDKIIDKLYPQFRMDLGAAESAQSVMFADARPQTEAIRQKIEIAEQGLNRVGLAYDKGQAILRMFEAWLGPDRFRDGVLRYLAAHEWANATADDLFRALAEPASPSARAGQQAQGQAQVKTPDISAAMATFLDQPGLPLIDVLPMRGGKLRLRQQRFTNHGVSAPPQTWRVPVSIKYKSGGAVRTHTVLLDTPEQVISLPQAQAQAPDWVFPFAGAVGYYRFTLPEGQLAALLSSPGAGAALTPPERLALLGNLAALLDAGLGGVHGDTYLRALARMAADPDPLVVDAVLGDSRMGLGKVHTALIPDALHDRFAAYVRRSLQAPKDRFGLRDRPRASPADPKQGQKTDDAVALLRPHLLRWLGDIGKDPDAATLAREQAQAFLKDPAGADPTLAGSALQVAAATGDQALFDAYRRGFEEARTPVERARFISALGAFRDPALREKALRYALSPKVRPNEVFTIVHAVRSDEKGRDLVFSWFTENYAAVTARLPDAALTLLPHLASGCEPARLQQARAFFLSARSGDRQITGVAEELAKVDAQVRDCVALRQREGAAVARFLGAPQK
jgi:alanyl aminopeptidase